MSEGVRKVRPSFYPYDERSISMRIANRLPTAIICVALAGCATKSDLNYLSYQLEEISTRLPKVEKNLGQLKTETKEGVEKNLKGVRSDLDAVRKGTADLQANLESMMVDMKVVAGKLDDAALAAKKPADDLILLREDLEHRFSDIGARLAKLEKALEDQQKKLAETPELIYQQGLEAFKGGDMQKAREILSRFLQLSPAHDLAANAHYWLGETYYNEKKLDQAVLEFQEVIKNFPAKDKAPAALLKQAMAFREMGDLKSARYLYKKLIDDYPGADEAKVAREKLQDMK